MAESQTKSDGYNNAVDRASLISIRLIEGSFKVESDFDDAAPEAKKYIHQTVEDHHFAEDSGVLLGRINCRIWMSRAEAQTDEERDKWFDLAIFAVDAEYIVAFDMPGEHEPDSLKTFFERMAPLACWPYFRSHVANVAAEAGISIPVVPIKKLRFPVKEAGGYIDPDETRHLLPKDDAS